MYVIWNILIGILVGYLASLIVRGSGSGCITNLVVGIVGSFLGSWLFSLAGVFPVGSLANFAMSVLGAVVLLLLVSLITRR